MNKKPYVNEEALQKAFCAETAYKGKFDPNLPEAGQCAPTALLVYNIIGGELRGCKVGRTRHFYNVINGEVCDYTQFQFDSKKLEEGIHNTAYAVSRWDLINSGQPKGDIRRRYLILYNRYYKFKKELEGK